MAPPAAAAGAVTTKSVPLTVASGASLKVRLGTTLDSGKNKAGDAFEGHLDQDLIAQGQIVATKGSRVQGKVREAKHAEGSQAPLLALELTGVASGGKMISITTNVTQSQGKAPQTVKKLLGGAAIGATIGAIADGGEGAAVGGIAGAHGGRRRRRGDDERSHPARGNRPRVPDESSGDVLQERDRSEERRTVGG